MPQGAGVMQADVLDVENREIPGLEDLHHFAQGRWIRAGENALFDPGVHGGGTVSADGVNQAATHVAQTLLNDPTQSGVVFNADVLEHANRYERVVLAGDVSIVILDEFD